MNKEVRASGDAVFHNKNKEQQHSEYSKSDEFRMWSMKVGDVAWYCLC